MKMTVEENAASNKSPWWTAHRKNPERTTLLLLLAVSILLIIGLIIGLALVSRKTADAYRSVCLTTTCVQEAAKLLTNMNPSVDPCDDFYEFACGGFLREAVIPSDKSEIGYVTVINDRIQRQLKTIIEEPSKEKEPKPVTLLKSFYRSCVNVTAIEDDGLKTARSILQDLGGWPVLQPRSWRVSNWLDVTQKLRRSGLPVGHFFELGVETDPGNSSRQILILDQAELEIREENLLEGLDDGLVDTFMHYMVDLAVMFGANRGFALREVRDVMEFRMKMANVSLPQEERRNKTALIHRMKVSEIQENFPRIPWLDFINSVMDLPNHQIRDDDTLIVVVPKYLQAMEVLLAETPERVQVNHALFMTMRALSDYLPEKFRDREQEYNKYILGTSKGPSRDDECSGIAAEAFGLTAASLYVQKHFVRKTKKNVAEIVTYVQKEFVKILEKVEWMDEETRKRAIRKAQGTEVHIGYPDEILDQRNLEDYYSGLEIDPENILESITKILKFSTDKAFRDLWKPVNKSDWTTRFPANSVNAFYHIAENSIQLPAGILQGIFFGNDRPNYMNYGSIGWIVGHEITHGFDDQGKQYDENGNLVNWWAKETDDNFEKRAKCIVDQYSNYTLPEVGLRINGINTQGENMADNGGIKASYLAYNSWLEQNGPEPKLPGVNFTPHQVFWITAANTWCAKERNEELEQILLLNEHSPERFRIIGAFSNIDHFAKDFGCSLGSKMNPAQKCSVW